MHPSGTYNPTEIHLAIHSSIMTILGYAVLLLGVVFFLFLGHWKRKQNSPITNWPVVGMVPGLIRNASQVYECTNRVLKHYGGTVEVKGPWFAGMDFIVTSDPMNIHYILSKNFPNYGKGPEIQEILEPLGDGILNSDSDWWTYQRKMMHSVIKNSKFELFLEKIVRQKVSNCLIPVLEHLSKQESEVDLQEVFKRFTFDNSCLMVLGFDPISLSVDFPKFTYVKAFDDMEAAVIYRHILPKWCWKFQRRLQLGQEKKLKKAWELFDGFLYKCISSKREELSRCRTQLEEAADFNLLTEYMMHEDKEGRMGGTDKFLRDTAFNLMAAGSDTVGSALTWFLWLVATHPSVETKILDEMRKNVMVKDDKKGACFGIKELDNLVYLHAALCEAFRLYPVIPFHPKTAVKADTLPSGHRVGPNGTIVIFLYAMGRMEELWGEDCLEYKPERWISEQGGIISVPSYKFSSFGGGPRSCLGKAMAFIQMKIVVSSILWNYHVQVVEGHPVLPSVSVVLQMKHGLKVKINKRMV
ncbi:alkane hydroxylase MAH1-like [Juglans regia]|uniref:Alkane hydroxylase MAH1-like n=2 Tax=Juglans regia TaxID=51240 RepID=A0A2I4DPH3_JUGRE|nr:alkane hydroxylase MAH1-like [Juglans regia]